jgi:hypothetical protein
VIIDKDQDINALLQDGELFLIIYQFKNDEYYKSERIDEIFYE